MAVFVKDPWDWGREARRRKREERAAMRALLAPLIHPEPALPPPPRDPALLVLRFMYPLARAMPTLTPEERAAVVGFINRRVEAATFAFDCWLESIPWAEANDGSEGA